MWELVSISLLIALYLIIRSNMKLKGLKEQERELKRNIARLENEYNDKLSDKEHNNTILLSENSKLIRFRYGVDDVLSGQRTDKDKVAKLKELLSKYR